MRQRRLTALLLALMLPMAACSSGATDDESPPETSAPTTPESTAETPTPTPSPSDEATTDPGEPLDGGVGESSTTITVPQWDEASQASALETARTILDLYGQNTLTAEQWWDQLQPHTSEEAAVWFESIDPRNIPTFTTEGEAQLLDAQATAWLARVQIPTDIGDFTVLLSRADGQAPWLLENIDLPESLD